MTPTENERVELAREIAASTIEDGWRAKGQTFSGGYPEQIRDGGHDESIHVRIALAALTRPDSGDAGVVEVQWEVYDAAGDLQAASDSEADGRHYLAVYSQDGPHKLVKATTVRIDPDARPTPAHFAGTAVEAPDVDGGMRSAIRCAIEVVEKHDAGRNGLIFNLQRCADYFDAEPPLKPERATMVYLEAEARRFASRYEQGSDGRNTFTIFADKIASLVPRPLPGVDAGVRGALAIFAEAANTYASDQPDSRQIIEREPGIQVVTLGDLRRARDALAALGGPATMREEG